MTQQEKETEELLKTNRYICRKCGLAVIIETSGIRHWHCPYCGALNYEENYLENRLEKLVSKAKQEAKREVLEKVDEVDMILAMLQSIENCTDEEVINFARKAREITIPMLKELDNLKVKNNRCTG